MSLDGYIAGPNGEYDDPACDVAHCYQAPDERFIVPRYVAVFPGDTTT